MAERRPIITLTSDFGLSDAYVAAMKAVLLRECPLARLVDISHSIPPQDVRYGAIVLERAVDGFPPRSVHLAVVDPGVGSDRRMIIANINRQWIVCPDNGLITWAWRLHPGGKVYELTWRPRNTSQTFHGRDIMAPVAGRVAKYNEVRNLGRAIDDPILLNNLTPATGIESVRIIHIDHFGNATTNLTFGRLPKGKDFEIRVKNKSLGGLRRTYWETGPGRPIALIGSSGLLEIAVRNGSARDLLKLKVGDAVAVQASERPAGPRRPRR